MRRTKNGFSLLEVLIAVQVLVLVLAFSAYAFNALSAECRNTQVKRDDLYAAQATLEQYKHASWDEIQSNSDNGVTVTMINAGLKRVKVEKGWCVLETIVYINGG